VNITRLAITNNRTSFTLLLVVILFGILAYQNMPKNYDPGFIVRTAQVVTYFPGASPERVEQLVSDKLEKVIQEIPELDFVSSESRTGVSIVLVNIKESHKNMRPIWDQLRREVDSIKGDLPSDAQAPIVNDAFGEVFGIVIGLTAEGYNYRELKHIADQVKDELLHLSEVAKIDIFGSQEERIFIEYNNSRLSELQLSPSQLGDQLSSRNIVIPGGSISLITTYPIGVEYSLVSFLAGEVEDKVNDFASNLVQAVVVVTIVMLLSLGLRTGLIVAVLIPSSMIFSILVMSFFKIGIDQISLAALIIALGMLVDNTGGNCPCFFHRYLGIAVRTQVVLPAVRPRLLQAGTGTADWHNHRNHRID